MSARTIYQKNGEMTGTMGKSCWRTNSGGWWDRIAPSRTTNQTLAGDLLLQEYFNILINKCEI
jgi:hypothetical protein